MSKIKIPEKLYVTAKPSQLWDSEARRNIDDYPLGFLGAYEPTLKAFQKRKRTQDGWAYGDQFGYEEIDGKIYSRPRDLSWCGYERSYVGWHSTIEPVQIQPEIWDNIPLTGVRILKFVSRDRGNKLWRVLDPRGVQFEISTACMEEILLNGRVEKGIICNTCRWVTSKNLVIVE